MDPAYPLIVGVTATFFLAGIVKGVTGMGLPTVAMALLGSMLGPLAAAMLLLVPSLVTNLWQLFAGPRFLPIAARLWPMMVAILVGTVIGAQILTRGDTQATTAALGIALCLYALVTLFWRPVTMPPRLEPVATPLVGLVTGLITGATGVFVIPAVPYLQSLGLPRDDLIQALGLSFTTSTIALALGLQWHGGIGSEGLVASCLAVAPALLGMWAGQALRVRISQAAFRRVFLIFLLLLGMDMAARPLW